MSDTTIKMMGRLQDNFTMISNEFGRNPNVTPRAARLFVYIASHETGWSLSVTATENATGLKRGTIFEALKDLRKLGYVKRYQKVDEGGRFSGTEYQVFLLPLPEDERDDIAVSANNRVRENSTRSDQQECDESAGGSRVRENRIRENRIRKNDTLKKTNTKKTNLQEDQLQEDEPPLVPPRGETRAGAHAGEEPTGETTAAELVPVDKPKPAKRTDRGTRLEDGWMPTQRVIDQMRQECPHVNLEYEHRKFTDYWQSTPGAKGRKTNWDATWRNWIRRASERPGGGNHHQPHRPPAEDMNNFEYYANRLIERLDAQEAQDTNQPQLTAAQWEITK